MKITDSIVAIKGIGEKSQKNFEKLDIRTVGDLLEHFPRDYDEYKPICSIGDLVEGEVAAIEGSLDRLPKVKAVRKLKILTCSIRDGSGKIDLTWFNMPFLIGSLHAGAKYIFRGKVIRKNGVLVMEQPQLLTKEQFYNKLHVLQPIYPLTAGITNNAVTKAVTNAVKDVDFGEDYLPAALRKEHNLISYKQAIKGIHFPADREAMLKARKRVVFDEFFLFALSVNQLKRNKQKKKNNYIITDDSACCQLIENLPYELTNAQKKVWQEVKTDLGNVGIMNRLIQGDVGSGKTIIAVLALLMAAKNGYQGAIMVPTEVLAKQHFESMEELLRPFGIGIELLVGSMTAKEKREACERIRNREVQIIVGTHALIQEKVEYDNLALVVTDEQHRFGVRQRENFARKGLEPHILVMSATPIPRTLAIILYGDLDLSVMDELPGNRIPIKNCVVNTGYRQTAYRFMEKEVEAGRQAYIICPMVEESENIEAENVLDYTEQLKSVLKPGIEVAYLHGKMKPKEKNRIMESYAKGEIQILVSTTVIEVGINVPNATVMMIENCERFGLAQLHQLRGRVGRGSYQSYCIFMLGQEGKETKERMEIMGKTNDGFQIAKEDLRLRGPGDMFGIRQSGVLEFKMADVFGDASVLQEANEAAQQFTEDDMKLMCKKYERLRNKIFDYCQDVSL